MIFKIVKTRRNSPGHRARRVPTKTRDFRIEELDDRRLLTADPANVFANFSGVISEAGEEDTIRIHLAPENFTIDSAHATLGFVLRSADGGGLSTPGPLDDAGGSAPGSLNDLAFVASGRKAGTRRAVAN